MAVIIKTVARGYRPSNKSVVKTKDTYPWAYKYDAPGGGPVQVRLPIIDKISITVPVQDPALKNQVTAALKTAESGKLSKEFQKAWKWPARKDYWIAINCTTSHGQSLLVQARHKSSDAHLLRLEFNPAKQWKWGLGLVKERFVQVTGGTLDWSHVIKYGRATRVDVAVDFVNAAITDLVFTSHTPGKNHIYVSEDGDIETVYVGIPEQNKPTEQLIYNKLQDAEDKGEQPLYAGINQTRMEKIVKSPNLKFSNIGNIPNPLSTVGIAHPPSNLAGVDPLLWKLFLETCRFRGTKGALSMLPADTASIFLAELNAATMLCWRPEHIWKHWPHVVKESGLLDPE